MTLLASKLCQSQEHHHLPSQKKKLETSILVETGKVLQSMCPLLYQEKLWCRRKPVEVVSSEPHKNLWPVSTWESLSYPVGSRGKLRLVFSIFETSNLFQQISSNGSMHTAVNSRIISATLGKEKISGLSDPVIAEFVLKVRVEFPLGMLLSACMSLHQRGVLSRMEACHQFVPSGISRPNEAEETGPLKDVTIMAL